jgi:hypothetical protein
MFSEEEQEELVQLLPEAREVPEDQLLPEAREVPEDLGSHALHRSRCRG